MFRPRALRHADQTIAYRVQHRKAVKRRIHLKADTDGSLVVIAPSRMSRRAIHDTLQERVQKVADFLASARKRLRETPDLQYEPGERHLFLGVERVLKLVETAGGRSAVTLTPAAIRIAAPGLDSARARNRLEAWYREQALNHFQARMNALAAQAPWVAGDLPAFRLRKMKRTWGNCSAKRGITLNLWLIKTPPHCIDYVIAHEICHLKEMNHGPAFYALQNALYPDWRQARTHLREKAHMYLPA